MQGKEHLRFRFSRICPRFNSILMQGKAASITYVVVNIKFQFHSDARESQVAASLTLPFPSFNSILMQGKEEPKVFPKLHLHVSIPF